MTSQLTRRTLVTSGLGVIGLGWALGGAGTAAAASQATAAPRATTARGRFASITGWPAAARVASFSEASSGTWAVGQQYDAAYTRSVAVLRRRVGGAWSTVALPSTFRATGSAVCADATGAWVAGTRNDVSLPDPDGSSVVGHVTTAGVWREVGTQGLTPYSQFGGLRVEAGLLRLTGMRPVDGGSSLAAFAATRPVDGPADTTWTSVPVQVPAWDGTSAYPLLRPADEGPQWATAGTALLHRQGAGWKAVSAPGAAGSAMIGAAVAQGRLLVATDDGSRSRLWSRAASAVSGPWTSVALPTGLGVQALAGSSSECWVVGTVQGSQDFGAMAVRVAGGAVVDRVGGPVSAGNEVGILDQAIITASGPVLAGYRADEPGGDAIGWTCRPVV